MRLAELEEMMHEEPNEAEAAVAELVSTANVEELSSIAKNGRVETLKGLAIEGLGAVGGPAATAALVELLESDTRRPRVGGTEQKIEHEQRQSRLVQSLARARNVPAPDVRNQRDVEEFIDSSRQR